LLLTTGAMILGAVVISSGADRVPRISVEDLKAKLGHSDMLVIDVRADGDWKNSKEKILGAVREDPSKVADWIGKYPRDKMLVFYCN
jgi:rhodanese-related sulfurtransferase